MIGSWALLLEIAQQGLIFSLVAIAVYLTSRVSRFDDLSIEGSFLLGGAATAAAVTLLVSPVLALPLSVLVGASTGAFTAFLHVRLGMNSLLSGICVTTAAFSIGLILAGANVPLPAAAARWLVHPIALVTIAVGALLAVRWLLQTEIGLLLRAAGENPDVVRRLGKSPERFKIVALSLAGGLTGLAGSLFVQLSGFFSITGSVGTLVAGMASLILGTLFSSRLGWGILAGACLYQATFALALALGMDPRWNALVKALLIVLLIQLAQRRIRCFA
jgi:putative tryptophan/tyrosine transport system permease protein